ncbi:MAG: hypothetical protein ACERKT_04170, partial [Acidobacteriota bacterium]
MRDADLSLLYLMRTRGHAPFAERAARLIAASGENGYLWLGIGLAGAAVDPPRRRRWLAASLIGPAAIGLNFGIKLLAKRPRPQLEGLPPLGGALLLNRLVWLGVGAAALFWAWRSFN